MIACFPLFPFSEPAYRLTGRPFPCSSSFFLFFYSSTIHLPHSLGCCAGSRTSLYSLIVALSRSYSRSASSILLPLQTADGSAAASASETPEAALLTRIGEQATRVRTLKSSKADKADIDVAVGDLLALKAAYKDLTGTACLVMPAAAAHDCNGHVMRFVTTYSHCTLALCHVYPRCSSSIKSHIPAQHTPYSVSLDPRYASGTA